MRLTTAYAPPTFLKPCIIVDSTWVDSGSDCETALLFNAPLNANHALAFDSDDVRKVEEITGKKKGNTEAQPSLSDHIREVLLAFGAQARLNPTTPLYDLEYLETALAELEVVMDEQQDKVIASVHKIIDNYSIHQPKGWPKGTVARRNLHNRLNKLARQNALQHPKPSDISLCDSCGCMTHTIDGHCGKCKAPKPSKEPQA